MFPPRLPDESRPLNLQGDWPHCSGQLGLPPLWTMIINGGAARGKTALQDVKKAGSHFGEPCQFHGHQGHSTPPLPLFRLLHNGCSGAAAFLSFFLFLYFSLEAGEGRAGSKSNTWLVINCKLQLNSIHLAKPRSLVGVAGGLRAVRERLPVGHISKQSHPIVQCLFG